mgnify:CR=1 FL=1
MKKIILSLMTLVSLTASAQFGGFGGRPQGNPWVPSEEAIAEDFKPALSNQDNKQSRNSKCIHTKDCCRQ